MTNKVSYHNYTLINTSAIGTYNYDVSCCDGLECSAGSFTLDITSTGKSSGNNLFDTSSLPSGVFVLRNAGEHLINQRLIKI
jgi:hypothetical protein